MGAARRVQRDEDLTLELVLGRDRSGRSAGSRRAARAQCERGHSGDQRRDRRNACKETFHPRTIGSIEVPAHPTRGVLSYL